MNVNNRLSEDVKIIGTLTVKEDLFIDCQLDGEINSKGNLTIGENAKIKGEISANNISVFGEIEGNLNAQNRCELKDSSTINGNVTTAVLKIVEGAIFNGRANVVRSAKNAKKPDLKTPSQTEEKKD